MNIKSANEYICRSIRLRADAFVESDALYTLFIFAEITGRSVKNGRIGSREVKTGGKSKTLRDLR